MRKLASISGVVGAVVVLLGLSTAVRADTVLTWGVGGTLTTDVLSGDFNTATWTFATSFPASSLSWSGDGYLHSHNGGVVNGTMELNVNGNWTSVSTFNTTSLSGLPISTLSPINFSGGTVSGIRFSSAPQQNQSYHNFTGDVLTFSGSGDAAAAPLPGVALAGAFLLTGVRGKGLLRRRRAA